MLSRMEKILSMFCAVIVMLLLIALLSLFVKVLVHDKWDLTEDEIEFLLVSDYEFYLNDECIDIDEMSRLDADNLFEDYEVEVYDGLKEVRFYSNKVIDFINKIFLDDLTLYCIIFSVCMSFGAIWVVIDDEE